MEAAAKATHLPRAALRSAVVPRSVPRKGVVPAPGCSARPKLSAPRLSSVESPNGPRSRFRWGGAHTCYLQGTKRYERWRILCGMVLVFHRICCGNWGLRLASVLLQYEHGSIELVQEIWTLMLSCFMLGPAQLFVGTWKWGFWVQCVIFSIQEGAGAIHVHWRFMLFGLFGPLCCVGALVVLVRQDHACGWLIERKGWPAGCQIQEASVLRHAINIPVVFQYIAK